MPDFNEKSMSFSGLQQDCYVFTLVVCVLSAMGLIKFNELPGDIIFKFIPFPSDDPATVVWAQKTAINFLC